MASAKRRTAPSPRPSPVDRRAVIAVTSGEPAGIGPDICLALAGRGAAARVAAGAAPSGALEVLHRPAAAPVVPGRLDPQNSRYVLALLDTAVDGCLAGRFDALVTAPVQKSVINDAGIPFTGHTEYLAARAGREVVMMLVGGGLRVALATTHLALAEVARAITPAGLERTLRIVAAELRSRFGLERPRILVAGLNPHAGEAGYLGREEIEVIGPVIRKLAAEGLSVRGPLPADTLFTPGALRDADCVVAMYHDQGLPVLKHAAFGRGVNVTLGLPFVRTSVDHGTALDVAGTGNADPSSLLEAVDAAVEMVGHERRRA
jgi:4-hydroxythreonine-4-phosphate dehydrogenase